MRGDAPQVLGHPGACHLHILALNGLLQLLRQSSVTGLAPHGTQRLGFFTKCTTFEDIINFFLSEIIYSQISGVFEIPENVPMSFSNSMRVPPVISSAS